MSYTDRVLEIWNQEFKLDEEEVQAYRAGVVDFEDWSDFVIDLPPISKPCYEPIELLMCFATPGIMPWLTGFVAYNAAYLADLSLIEDAVSYDQQCIVSDFGSILSYHRESDNSFLQTEESINRSIATHKRMTGQDIPRKFVLNANTDELMEKVSLGQKQLLAEIYSKLRTKMTDEGVRRGLDSYLSQFLMS